MMKPSPHQPNAQTPGPRPLEDGELDRWRERVAAAPDLRMTKVMRVRRAIVSRSYDEDASLEQALDAIHNEVAVLCLADHADDEPV